MESTPWSPRCFEEQGYEVIGLFMKNWEDDDTSNIAVAPRSGRRCVVADNRVEIEAINFSAEYRERVFSDFLREYRRAGPPNPDVLCNIEIKYEIFS